MSLAKPDVFTRGSGRAPADAARPGVVAGSRFPRERRHQLGLLRRLHHAARTPRRGRRARHAALAAGALEAARVQGGRSERCHAGHRPLEQLSHTASGPQSVAVGRSRSDPEPDRQVPERPDPRHGDDLVLHAHGFVRYVEPRRVQADLQRPGPPRLFGESLGGVLGGVEEQGDRRVRSRHVEPRHVPTVGATPTIGLGSAGVTLDMASYANFVSGDFYQQFDGSDGGSGLAVWSLAPKINVPLKFMGVAQEPGRVRRHELLPPEQRRSARRQSGALQRDGGREGSRHSSSIISRRVESPSALNIASFSHIHRV